MKDSLLELLLAPPHAMYEIHKEHGWKGTLFVLAFVVTLGGAILLMIIEQFK